MKRDRVIGWTLALLIVGGTIVYCIVVIPPLEDTTVRPTVPPVVIVSHIDSIRGTPADVVRLWLDAAKRGDAEAMSALWAEDERPRVKASPHSFATRVASGTLHAATWHVGAEAGEGEKRTVTAHVVWREHPDGGDNLEFRFLRREGR